DLGVGVILGEPFDVVIEGIARGRGEQTSLPPAAAESFAEATGLLDVVARADERRADRRAETFAEADAHGVEQPAPLLRGNPAGDDSVEEAGAVEVAGQTVRGGPGGDLFHLRERQDAPAAAVVGVF